MSRITEHQFNDASETIGKINDLKALLKHAADTYIALHGLSCSKADFASFNDCVDEIVDELFHRTITNSQHAMDNYDDGYAASVRSMAGRI